jgi:UDP-N-acetylenolpyruvoylglucosamine reductase
LETDNFFPSNFILGEASNILILKQHRNVLNLKNTRLSIYDVNSYKELMLLNDSLGCCKKLIKEMRRK